MNALFAHKGRSLLFFLLEKSGLRALALDVLIYFSLLSSA